MLIRTEIGDELMRRFVIRHNGRQIVLLGAGFDTRGYRIDCVSSKTFSNLKYYEIDIKTTQEVKLETLKKYNIDTSHVTYVPVDFSAETFSDCLAKKGWTKHQPTLFLWEGCTMYLDGDIVIDTLKTVASCPSGTYIYFDVMVSSFIIFWKSM